ncbi:hypothetical protein HN873_044063, partial [Arachis hypogaea]
NGPNKTPGKQKSPSTHHSKGNTGITTKDASSDNHHLFLERVKDSQRQSTCNSGDI